MLFLVENRLNKYFVYALGEVILLVIGILIALQINNWNSNRKDRLKELAYIQSLLTDLEQDETSLQNFIADSKEIGADLERLLLMGDREAGNVTQNDSLHLQFAKAFRLRTWPHNNRTLNQLESNGEFILLQPEVADSIAVYKLMVERLKQQEGGCKNLYRKGLETANKYLHRHLIRYRYNRYINQDRELTGISLPPVADNPALRTELFNIISSYQGCMYFYIFERAEPLLDYTRSLTAFLKDNYNLE